LLYPFVQVTAHVGLLSTVVAIVALPFVIEQLGVPHTAYNVVLPLAIMFLILAFNPYDVPVPSAFVFHPVNTLELVPVPFVMLHVLLFQVGVVQVPSYVHVMLPAVVPVAPPHVPLPPFLFRLIVNVFAVHEPVIVAVPLYTPKFV
jgi:hypothetical protein